jgi:serine/threonine-protein kinase
MPGSMAEPAETSELAPGALFAGRYEVEASIGRGGMGSVYRVRDRSVGEVVALKVLTPLEGADAAAALARFRQEVRLARRVTHPNVARVYDLGEHDGRTFLTMELVEGGTLRALMRAEAPFPAARAVAYACDLLDGLAAAHAAGVVHRDLKPGNVLVDPRGRLVITDFGIARALEEDSGLTVGAIGTPSYMAPEQAANAGVDERVDIYAVGLTLYEMLTGALPPRGASAKKLLDRASVSPKLAAIIARLLSPDPASRPRSAADVAGELRALGEGALEAADAFVEASTVSARALAEPSAARSPLATTGPVSSGARTTRTPCRSLPDEERSLAVLPLRYRGPTEHRDVGDAFTDELVDQLARTRGLRVFSSGATARFRDDRDPIAVRRALGADVVIDGVVAREGDLLRVTARLLDAASGVQLWSDRVEVRVDDALAAAESIARRVAEELRVEISVLQRHGGAPEDVVSAYFSARKYLRLANVDALEEACQAFTRCIARAPDFSPAYAHLAMATLRKSFIADDPDGSLKRLVEARVADALARAPELAETHLAAALEAGHVGDFARAADELERTLDIAPTYADAQETLGMLQCEAGRRDEGLRRLRLSIDLDPTLVGAPLMLAQEHALDGDHAACDAAMDAIEARVLPTHLGLRQVRLRLALWRGAIDRVAREVERIAQHSAGGGILRVAGEVALRARPLGDIDARVAELAVAGRNKRYLALVHQLRAEVHALLGDADGALVAVEDAAQASMIDVRWLGRCPLLAPLRGREAFDRANAVIAARATPFWR